MAASDELERILAESSELARAGRDEDNEALLRSAVSRFPPDAELALRTGTALIGRSPDEAKQMLRRAVSLAPDDPWKLTRCAHLMFHLGELDEARIYTKRASLHAPADFEYGAALIHLAGKLAAAKGNDELAEKLLSLAFKGDPGFGSHGRVLAEFYARHGRFVEALDVISESLSHRPGDEALEELRRRILADVAEED